MAIRAGRAAAHDEVVSKHAATMRAVMEKHANAIEELTAKEARRAEEGEANSGFPLLAPGPLTAPAGTAVLIPAYNLQSAAQSDFYRCKFQEQVVDAVFVHAKDRVTGKVGQYLKCTPPARETLENPVAVSVQASIDAGKTFFGQGVTFSYPGAHEVPQDDPSSFESVLVLRRAAEAWKKACDVAVAKSKNASTVVPVTPESEKVRALMASNARVACQRFSDATNDATNAAAAMHARVNAEKAAIIAQNASGYAKALNASAKDMLAKGRAMVANGTKLYNKALAAVNLLRSEIANATARAHAAEDHAAEYLKMNQAAHAERTKHQTALHTQILATTKLENIVDQLTIQLKKQKGMEQAHSAGVAHSTEVETIQMRLDVAAKNLAAARHERQATSCRDVREQDRDRYLEGACVRHGRGARRTCHGEQCIGRHCGGQQAQSDCHGHAREGQASRAASDGDPGAHEGTGEDCFFGHQRYPLQRQTFHESGADGVHRHWRGYACPPRNHPRPCGLQEGP